MPTGSTRRVPGGVKSLSRFFVVILCSVSLAVVPIRQTQAAFPILLLPGVTMSFQSGTLAASYAAAIALVGGSLYFLQFKNPNGDVVLQVAVNPKAPQDVPAGWTPGANPWDAPVPPSSPAGGGSTEYTPTGTSFWNTDANAAVNAYCVSTGHQAGRIYGGNPGSECASAGTIGCWECQFGGSWLGNNGNMSSRVGCPAGYSGDPCTLSDASAVEKPSNAKAELAIIGDTFQYLPNDPDNTGTPPENYILTPDGKIITLQSGTEKSQITINPDNSLTVEHWQGRGDGTSDYMTLQFAPANSGASDGGRNLQGGTNQRVIGEGGAAWGGGAPAAGSGVVECPGCAQESTLSDFRNKAIDGPGVRVNEQGATWQAERDSASTSMQSATTDYAAHQQKLEAAAAGGGIAGVGVAGLSDFVAPTVHEASALESLLPAAQSCSALAFNWRGTYSIDPCPVVNFIRPMLDWFLAALTAIYVYAVFWRRRQGGE